MLKHAQFFRSLRARPRCSDVPRPRVVEVVTIFTLAWPVQQPDCLFLDMQGEAAIGAVER